jgi:hypothetical protein
LKFCKEIDVELLLSKGCPWRRMLGSVSHHLASFFLQLLFCPSTSISWTL